MSKIDGWGVFAIIITLVLLLGIAFFKAFCARNSPKECQGFCCIWDDMKNENMASSLYPDVISYTEDHLIDNSPYKAIEWDKKVQDLIC